jgi:hypothetical protein
LLRRFGKPNDLSAKFEESGRDAEFLQSGWQRWARSKENENDKF